MLNQKSLLISLAVLTAFTITSTGCGKSKESRSDVRGTTVTQEQTEQQNLDQLPDGDGQGAPLPTTVIDGVQALPKSEGSGGSALPVGEQGGGLAPLPKSGSNDNGGGADTLPQSGKGSKKQNGAVAVKFDEAEAVKTGGKLDALNFTSSGNDGLMTEFRSYNNKVAGDQKTLNLNLAKAVINAKLNRAAGSLTVDLTLDESLDGVKKITSYRLQGKSSDAGDRQILKQTATNGDLEYQGGFLKCIDVDGGCESAYIKIKLEGAYLRVIFRNAYADRFFILEQGSEGSSFNLWKTYLMNTTNGSSTSQKLAHIKTSSFEVVNGRSAMGVLMTTDDGEMVGLSVPLLVADTGTVAGSNASKANDISKNYDLASSANARQNLAQAIREAKLVNNNGKGDIRLRLDLSSGSQKGAMWLTLSPLAKPTLSIAEISSFENKIPKF